MTRNTDAILTVLLQKRFTVTPVLLNIVAMRPVATIAVNY